MTQHKTRAAAAAAAAKQNEAQLVKAHFFGLLRELSFKKTKAAARRSHTSHPPLECH